MIKSDILYDEFDGPVELREISHHHQCVQTVHKSEWEAKIARETLYYYTAIHNILLEVSFWENVHWTLSIKTLLKNKEDNIVKQLAEYKSFSRTEGSVHVEQV